MLGSRRLRIWHRIPRFSNWIAGQLREQLRSERNFLYIIRLEAIRCALTLAGEAPFSVSRVSDVSWRNFSFKRLILTWVRAMNVSASIRTFGKVAFYIRNERRRDYFKGAGLFAIRGRHALKVTRSTKQ
jgi:hypothetical protein